MKTKRYVFIRCIYFYTEVDIYMSPLVLRAREGFFMPLFKYAKNIWLKTNNFLPLNK